MQTRSLWMLQLLCMAAVVAWAMCDLQFDRLADSLASILVAPLATIRGTIDLVGITRTIVMGMLMLIAISSMTILWIKFFRAKDNPKARSITSLLAITTAIALWFGIAMNYPSLAWQGKRIRVAIQVNSLEQIAQPLRTNWPSIDGELPDIGAFMAYPFGQPSTLILLEPPPVAGTGLSVSAIERGPDGSIRLQLSSLSHNDWAQWHPPGSYPKSFTGGLGNLYELRSTTTLTRGWYLVRYQPA